jgi:hypothetical protein
MFTRCYVICSIHQKNSWIIFGSEYISFLPITLFLFSW